MHKAYRHIFIHINVYIGANSRIDGQLCIHICHLNFKVDPSRGLVCLNMGDRKPVHPMVFLIIFPIKVAILG